MTEETYVALVPLRFGERELMPGEAVPVLPGRNYPRMVELGQIAKQAPVTGLVAEVTPSTPEPQPLYPVGARLLFVPLDGKAVAVDVMAPQPIPTDVQEQLGATEQAVWVQATGTGEEFVALAHQLLWQDAAQRLVAPLEQQLLEAQARPTLPADAEARLESVSGIGKKLAKEAVEALMAPAPETSETEQ